MNSTFPSYLKRQLPLVEGYLMAHLPRPEVSTTETDDLEHYLFGPLRRFVSGGGKRVRPALCLLGAEAADGDPKEALAVASAMELFQTAALVHDDIADESELRRGQPCVHVTEGTGLAINVGDASLVAVFDVVLRGYSHDVVMQSRLLEEIVSMEMRTIEGQALDLGWARDERWDVTVEDYLRMASLKTAYYTCACPLALGAICAHAPRETVDGLKEFGLLAGLAFQIQDDLLNLVANADGTGTGKDWRSDITEGKRTLVMVHALAHLTGPKRERLIEILSSHTTDEATLAEAVDLAEQAGSIAFARERAAHLAHEAKASLSHLSIASQAREVLRSMADFFVERAS